VFLFLPFFYFLMRHLSMPHIRPLVAAELDVYFAIGDDGDGVVDGVQGFASIASE
jgi:hypothetical protein